MNNHCPLGCAFAAPWQFYIQLVEVEAAFKTMKDDLQLRPIYHQLEERIEAHIFVAFLAYCLHVTLRARLKPLAGGLTPRAVLDKLAAVQMLDVNFPTTDGRTLSCAVTPSWGPSKSSWSSNSSSICRRNHHHASPRQQRRFPSHPTPCSGDFRDASVDIAHFFTPVEKVGLIKASASMRHFLNQGSRTPVDCQAISLSTTRKHRRPISASRCAADQSGLCRRRDGKTERLVVS